MAQSVTGVGMGSCGKYTVNELSILANMSILVSGRVELSEDFLVNPPSPTATVVLNALPGSKTNYVILTTGLNTGATYVATMTNNSDGDFSEFRVIGESEGTCMYVIMKVGSKPNFV